MDIFLDRHNTGSNSTIGIIRTPERFWGYTCEDEPRDIKVDGETRIGKGSYEIKLRTEDSPMNQKYSDRYHFHRGMLWLQDVGSFTYVYIHTGNNESQTDACILVGYDTKTNQVGGGGTVQRSRDLYTDLYQVIIRAIDSGEKIFIHIRDEIT